MSKYVILSIALCMLIHYPVINAQEDSRFFAGPGGEQLIFEQQRAAEKNENEVKIQKPGDEENSAENKQIQNKLTKKLPEKTALEKARDSEKTNINNLSSFGNQPDKNVQENYSRFFGGPGGEILIFEQQRSGEKIDLAATKPSFVKLSGYIKFDAYFNSRQFYDADTLGLAYIMPKPPLFDANGNDINDEAQTNLLAIQSRINIDIVGPQVENARTAALISMDFIDPDIFNNLHLRRAFVLFDWVKRNTKLILGHDYHPLSLDACYPDTLGWSLGTLFDPFSYNPQIRLHATYQFLMTTFALSGDTANLSLRNALVPDMFIAAQINYKDHNFGIGFDYQVNTPRLATDPLVTVTAAAGMPLEPRAPIMTTSSLASAFFYVFMVLRSKGLQVKFRFNYVENGNRFGMLGGLAVSEWNPLTDFRKYTNLRALAYWTEIIYQHKKSELGIFMGYTNNIGAERPIIPQVQDREGNIVTFSEGFLDPNIGRVFKFQPRVRFYVDPINFGLELEYAVATYGTRLNRWGTIHHPLTVSSYRLLFALFYNF